MRRNNNNRRFNNNKRRNTRKNMARQEISQQITLGTNIVTRLISLNKFLYANTSPAHYSFTSGTDTRYFPFQDIATSQEFINLQGVYQEFRIEEVSILLSRVNTESVGVFPILYMNVNTGGTGANPNNTLIIESPTSRLFSPVSTRMELITYKFNGVSNLSAHIWQNTTGYSGILGQIFIGDNGVTTTSPAIRWDLKIAFKISYRNPF